MPRNIPLYSSIFISGIIFGIISKDYLPEEYNSFKKIGQKLTTMYQINTTKLSSHEIANRAEQRLKNNESKSSSL